MGDDVWGQHRWLAGVRWAAALAEPLLSWRQRDTLERDLRSAGLDNPPWIAGFLAGVASDMAQSLPEVDPWRSAVIGPDGPMTNGRPFGRLVDHADLVPQISPDPTIDVALVAVVEPLSPAAAGLIVRAFDGRQAATDWLASVREQADDAAMIEAGIDAVLALVFRRRSMIGMSDVFVVDSCWWWSEYTHQALIGEVSWSTVDAYTDDRTAHERIPDNQYVADPEWLEGKSPH